MKLAAAVSPEQPDGRGDWYLQPVNVSIEAEGGVPEGLSIQYRVNGGEWQAYDAAFTIDTDGVNTVEYRAVHTSGETGKSTLLAIPIDRTAPSVNVTLDQAVLWPPNQKLAQVNVVVEASDEASDIDSVVLTSITSNEELQPEDIQDADYGTPDTAFLLRAARSGQGSGRIYTITYTVTDQAGNETVVTAEVQVPHDGSEMKESGLAEVE
ncbi:hypothetical protein [Paenibacillus lactis]|uniref:hypothetical protein n=1 Tax=Paenibacillus lactis TaxID=228574 RepID=UPI0036B0808D